MRQPMRLRPGMRPIHSALGGIALRVVIALATITPSGCVASQLTTHAAPPFPALTRVVTFDGVTIRVPNSYRTTPVCSIHIRDGSLAGEVSLVDIIPVRSRGNCYSGLSTALLLAGTTAIGLASIASYHLASYYFATTWGWPGSGWSVKNINGVVADVRTTQDTVPGPRGPRTFFTLYVILPMTEVASKTEVGMMFTTRGTSGNTALRVSWDIVHTLACRCGKPRL